VRLIAPKPRRAKVPLISRCAGASLFAKVRPFGRKVRGADDPPKESAPRSRMVLRDNHHHHAHQITLIVE